MVKPLSKLEQPETRSVLRRLLHKPVQQQPLPKTKKPFLKALVAYLTSDSYMYGTILSQPAPDPPALLETTLPKAVDRSGGTTPLSNNREASNLSSLQSPAAPTSFDLLLANSTLFHSPPDKDILTDQDDDSARSWSATESLYLLDDFVPLHKEAAKEVARRLVRNMAGRYSKELGVYVDVHDSEVERWFLATTFLDPSNIESSAQMMKKLQNLGISKILDVLSVEQRDLEELFDDAVHTPRTASRLQKLASALQKDHRIGICALKRIPDYAELKREMQNLPGYNRNAVRLFLRELRGVWPGATPDIEVRTMKAARHLHLVSSLVGRDGSEMTASIINLAREAGLDERDLELALVKLSLQHARQYKQCLGGSDCELLRTPFQGL